MWLSNVSIRRPVFAAMLIGALVTLGWISIGRLGVDLFPRVEFPVVTVTTVLEGATPQTVESEITEVLEAHINTISGIDILNSESSEGLSQIFVRFELEENVDIKAQDVREKVALARRELPIDAEPPIVEKLDPDAAPIVSVMVAGPLSQREITRFADDVVKERLERLAGVGSVTLVGGRDREVRIWLDAYRLRGHGLTADDVIRAIQTEHAELPGGRLEVLEGTSEFTFKTKGELETVEAFNDIVIAYREGGPIRVRHVARVEDGVEDARTHAELDGQLGVSLLVRRQSGKNTVEVARAVKRELEGVRAIAPPGVRITVAKDLSRFIESAIRDVTSNMILGGILAVLVTLGFLRSVRTTLIVGIAIPASIISAFFFFYLFDFTINMLTLMALSISIGLLIDDAIVVLENIYRHVEAGEPPLQAAFKGTAEIGPAVMVGSFAICAVFVPIAFMGEIIGRFFHAYGLAVVFAVAVSLLTALTLTPALCSRTLRRRQHHGRIFSALERAFTRLEEVYRRILRGGLRHRPAVMAVAVLAMIAGVQIARTIPLEFSSSSDRSEFDTHVELPLGTGIEETKRVSRRVAKALRDLEHVESTFVTVGSGSQGRVNEADIYLKLTPKLDRSEHQLEVMDTSREVMRVAAPEAKSVSATEISWVSGGGFRSYIIDYSVLGPDLDRLQVITDEIVKRLRESEIFVDAKTSFDAGKPEVQAVIDRKRAADLGISVRALASTLRALIGGVKIATYEEFGSRYDVRVRLEEEQRDDLAELGLIQIRALDGRLADLENVAALRVSSGPVQIDRENRSRQIKVFANTRPGVSLGPAADRVDAIVAEVGLPAGYEGRHRGPVDRMKATTQAIRFAFMIALIALYMILASQFNSFVQPAVIMLCAPLSFFGAFAALSISDLPLSLWAQIGLVILMGLVMKNGILLVDYANRQRVEGVTAAEAMLRAGPVRLRPVLMTTISTIFGMLPVAFSRTDGAEFRNAMGILLIGGLLSSMLLTLVVVPVFYTLIDDWGTSVRSLASRVWGPVADLARVEGNSGAGGAQPGGSGLPRAEAEAAAAGSKPRRRAATQS
jgi:HAE1 family hydrophobic/amphiphilic exporter-1